MILGIITDDYYPKEGCRWGGTGWARIGKYLPHLPDHWSVHIAHQVWPCSPSGIAITDHRGKKLEPDVLWCQRVFMPNFHYEVAQARINGQRVVTDIDDMLWGLHPESYAVQHWTASHIREVIASMAVSDEVISSTPWLANHMRLDLHLTSTVIRNTVDTEAFKLVDQAVDEPVVGWAGAVATRSGDLEKLKDVLPHIDAPLQHSGYIPGLAQFYDKTGIHPDITRGMVHPQDMGSILDFHIGLIPLSNWDFNKAKSDIKGLEYAAAGIPFVASPLPAYKQLHKEWGDVVRLASTEVEWVDHITELLDFETRQAESVKLRSLASTRDISSVCQELTDVLLG